MGTKFVDMVIQQEKDTNKNEPNRKIELKNKERKKKGIKQISNVRNFD